MKIYINPSNQPDNLYADGKHNERDVMREVAALVADALKRCGQTVKVGTGMESGVKESNAWGANVHVPIHSNACAGHMATGPRVFYGRAEAQAKTVHAVLWDVVGGAKVEPTREKLYEINNVTADTIYIEVAFHDNPKECKLILSRKAEIAEAICKGLCEAYGVKYVPEAPHQGGTKTSGTGDGAASWAKDATEWCKANGVFVGDGKGNYDWQRPVTRQELAAVLYRMSMTGQRR